MRRSTLLGLRFSIVALSVLGSFASADALVRIHVDLSTQRMQVDSDDGSYSWPVSTARSGYVTPDGTFAPQSLQRMHYSHKYHMSPMPYSIFFRGGFAIHGTYETAYLGHPVSHGCVRLAPANAAILFRMVKAEGATIETTYKQTFQLDFPGQIHTLPGFGAENSVHVVEFGLTGIHDATWGQSFQIDVTTDLADL